MRSPAKATDFFCPVLLLSVSIAFEIFFFKTHVPYISVLHSDRAIQANTQECKRATWWNDGQQHEI